MQQETTFKKVRFNEAANKQHESAHDVEDSKTSWYQRGDFKGFSYQALKTARTVQFNEEKDNAKSYASVVTNIYVCCMEGKLPSTNAFQYYVHWNLLCPERRGIERYCIQNMNKSMQRLTSDSNVMVLSLQTKLVLERVPLEQRTEMIQSAYKKQVQPARVFARIQGIADALASRETATPQEAGKKRTLSNDSSDLSIARLPVKKRKLRLENCRSRSTTPPLPSRQVVAL